MSALIKRISQNYPLFIMPTFLSGIASCFDLYGALNSFRYYKSPGQADLEEIKSDWKMVGLDVEKVMSEEKTADVKAA